MILQLTLDTEAQTLLLTKDGETLHDVPNVDVLTISVALNSLRLYELFGGNEKIHDDVAVQIYTAASITAKQE